MQVDAGIGGERLLAEAGVVLGLAVVEALRRLLAGTHIK